MDVAHLTYVFDEGAGSPTLVIKGEMFKYLIKVRRHDVGDMLAFRHPDQPSQLYHYELVSIDGRRADLQLQKAQTYEVKAERFLHIGWCMIDARSVEKVLPSLNELGVARITFIGCDRSQKNFKPDFKRYERILESSMQQCGRSEKMEFATVADIATFIKANPACAVFDFCETVYTGKDSYETVLIGAEGGFSDKERLLLQQQKVFRLDTPMILRSETTAVAIAGKILL